MRILIFNWRDITHPWAGGAEVYIHEIGKRLVEKGHNVTLFCGKYSRCKEKDTIDGINIIRKGGRFSIYIRAPIYYLYKLRNKYDIVIDCENGIPFFTPLFVRKPKICIVHHIHKDIFDIEMPFYISWLGKYLETNLMPKIYKDIQFVAVSPSTKKEMIDIGIDKEKIKIIFNGINGQLAPDLSKKKDNMIVYIGRIKIYKQLDHLIKAFRIVKDNIPDSRLIIAGKGYLSELKILSESLDLELDFYDKISDQEKLDLLQRAKIFATSSIKEGWGLTVIEANRCGTPVISYNVSGLKDSIRNNETGILVSPGNIKEFATSIIDIIKNDDFRILLSKNAIIWSENFDWDRSAEEFNKML